MRTIILFLFLLSVKLSAQNLTYSSVDSSSYALIVNNQFDDLKKLGKEALKQDIDFYLLRLRLGIAFYNEQNYEMALMHFEKAFKMFPTDDLLIEYLYYSYLFTNRTYEAKAFFEKMSEKHKKNINTSTLKNNIFILTAGNISNTNYADNGSKNITGSENIYAETTYNKNINFATLMINHKLVNKYEIMYAANIFNTTSIGRVQTTDENKTSEYSNYHSQFNIGLRKHFKRFNISMFGAFFTQKLSILTSNFDLNTFTYNYFTLENNFSNFSIGTQINKRFKFINPSISIAYSNFLNSNQIQTELSVVAYPKGNLDLYSVTSLNNYFSKDLSKLLFRQKIGLKLSKHLWTETECSIGNHHYFVTNQAMQTYNSFDPMKLSVGLNLIFVFRNIQISPSYKYQIKEGAIMRFINSNETQTSNFKYNNNLIYTSLIWNF